MKLITEYLEDAARFERMAAEEKDPKVKAMLVAQATAYYKLAVKRAEEQGVRLPKRPD
jgi:hypothetical protein